MKTLVLSMLMAVSAASSTQAADVPDAFLGRAIHEDAANEVKHWGSLIGDWDVRWESYDEAGAAQKQGAATWHWYSALNGFALVDFYTHPMKDPIKADRVGANFRVFDKKENKWKIRWSHNFGNGYESFDGVQIGDEIIIYELGKETEARIRFFDFTDDAFRQQEEKSSDGGKTWRASFKAWATRIETK